VVFEEFEDAFGTGLFLGDGVGVDAEAGPGCGQGLGFVKVG
jgi:hypothetical protein